MQTYKYPRTWHLPTSRSVSSDDNYSSQEALDFLSSGIELVTTEKMDGGNITMHREYIHARSSNPGVPEWENATKGLWGKIRYDIPEGWRISGESLWARKSVSYSNLPSIYMIFAIWDDQNNSLSWNDVECWSELIGIPTVPVLYRGSDFNEAQGAWGKVLDEERSEGFVIRNASSFHFDDFAMNVSKWVRNNHIRTSDDWRHRNDYAVNEFNSDTVR